MTSQRWLTDAEFSPDSQSGSIWWHYLVVIVPDELKYTRNGTIWITGCGMDHIPNQGDEDVVLAAALATNTGVVTGVLFQVFLCCVSVLIIFFIRITLYADPQRAHDL